MPSALRARYRYSWKRSARAKRHSTEIADIVTKLFDLRPKAIIEKLQLRKPIYRQTAAYGHFGRDDLDLPWERLDMVEAIKKEI